MKSCNRFSHLSCLSNTSVDIGEVSGQPICIEAVVDPCGVRRSCGALIYVD